MLNDYIKPIEAVGALFDDKKIKDIDQAIDMLKTQYELLVAMFDNSEDEESKQWAVKYSVSKTIPLLNKMLASPKLDEKGVGIVYSLYKRVYAFCGRRSLAHFIDYMEWDRPTDRKVFVNRREVLNPIVYYLNKMTFDKNFTTIIISLPPGYGKTFSLNYWSAWLYGIDLNNSILRLSYNDDLLNGFSRSIKDLIASDTYAEVFPSFALYKNKPFDKEKDSDWKIKNADVLVSHYVRTRDSGITGVRARAALVIDDITKGAEEAYDDNLHDKMWQKYLTEWWNRRDGTDIKYVFAGTMWTPKDILNRITEQEGRQSEFIQSPKFKYAFESEDGHAVAIRVPLLDENEHSTCPKVISTKDALRIKDETDPFLFSCVYQQEPIAPSGLEFAWENLQQYSELPTNLKSYAYAVIDPTRKGKDNISMPICLSDNEGDKHYLIDWYYKKVAMSEAYDEIVDKIIANKIIELTLENNTDTSLKTVLEIKLKEKGYLNCVINEKYNTVKKEIRIKDMRGHIVRRMVFKKKGSMPSNSDYSRAMEATTKYSFDYANKFDDAPDSLALYVSEIILGGKKNKVEIINRSTLGF